jgi:hypothetical protein
VRVWGRAPLNLKAYQIGGLSKAMGMLRMHEEIVVHLDLTFASGQGEIVLESKPDATRSVP